MLVFGSAVPLSKFIKSKPWFYCHYLLNYQASCCFAEKNKLVFTGTSSNHESLLKDKCDFLTGAVRRSLLSKTIHVVISFSKEDAKSSILVLVGLCVSLVLFGWKTKWMHLLAMKGVWVKCMASVMKPGWIKLEQYWWKIEVSSSQFNLFYCSLSFFPHRSGSHNEKTPDEIWQPLWGLLPLFNGMAW